MGKNFGTNVITIDNNSLTIEDDFFPLNFTSNGKAEGALVMVGFGIEAADLEYNDYEDVDVNGKIALINISSPDGIHPHSKYLDYHGIKDRVKVAEGKGAIGILLYNDDPTASDPKKNYTDKIARVSIPVAFVTNSEILSGAAGAMEISLEEDERVATNVIGYIDNQAESTVILGAHFDHLGYGKHGGSLYRDGEDAIHNGADDNASGTAMLIELARNISSSELKNTNFLFIAFSGEEKGLLGANYFTKNPTIDLLSADYMINMDMVGRLDTTEYNLAISGTGTSPTWANVLEEQVQPPLHIVTSESGVGPSDHTSFYLSDIPVLHFFTGTHENYHKPSDDEPLINYDGMVMVYDYILRVATALNDEPKLAFTKTKDANSRSAPSFNVTLGIVPDYMYDKGGVKVDGVSDGKPGANAGLVKGDIVLQIGDFETNDMYEYMDALSNLKKGEKANAKIQRDGEEMELEIQF
jgi:hypothetical protein